MHRKRFRIALVACCLCATLPGGLRADTIDDYVTAEMARRHIPGVALTVVRNGRIERVQGYGFANLEHQVPMHPDTLFKTGAVGMQFTAVAVMLLVEEGKIGLDDSVRKYLPNTPRSWQPITIRNLLNHTSGLPATPGGEFLVEYTDDSLLAVISKLPLNYPAETRWRFSFSDYIVLGFIMDTVTGDHYTKFLARRLFGPLNMRTAQPIDDLAVIPNRAAGYEMVEGAPRNPPSVSAFATSTADGSLYLSALDYAAWASGGLGRTVLKPESWAHIAQAAHLKSGRSYPYGFGWFQQGDSGHALWQHSGSWQGFQAAIASYPGDDLTLVVLANGSDADPAGMIRNVATLLDPKFRQAPGAPIADTEPHITGTFRMLLGQIAEGSEDKADFVDFSQRDFTDMMTMYRATLKPLGALAEVALFGRGMLGDDRLYRYRARYEKGAIDVRLGFAPNGRIGTLELMPVDDWTAPLQE